MIETPLWSLMLSAHGCDPACGCDARFDLSAGALRRWVSDHGPEEARRALAQIDALLLKPRDELAGGIGRQARISFESPGEARAWLAEWRRAILQALANGKANEG